MLREQEQSVKLAMYDRLATALFVAVALVVVVAVLTAAVGLGVVSLPWQWTFLFTNQWDVIYVGILIAVGAIWFPGERAARYAYYAQAAGTEADAHDDDDDDDEGTAAVDLERGTPPGDDDGDGDVELAAITGGDPVGPRPGRVRGLRDDAFAVHDEDDDDDNDEGAGDGSVRVPAST